MLSTELAIIETQRNIGQNPGFEEPRNSFKE
jgi:hypothetical protein